VARQVFPGAVPQLEVCAFHVADPLHAFVDEHELIDTAMRTTVTTIEMRDLDVDTTTSCPILGFLSTTPIGRSALALRLAYQLHGPVRASVANEDRPDGDRAWRGSSISEHGATRFGAP
jgi:hypothetical protein